MAMRGATRCARSCNLLRLQMRSVTHTVRKYENSSCHLPRMRRKRVAPGFSLGFTWHQTTRAVETAQAMVLPQPHARHLPPFHGDCVSFDGLPHAEAWGYAPCSLRERIAIQLGRCWCKQGHRMAVAGTRWLGPAYFDPHNSSSEQTCRVAVSVRTTPGRRI